MKKGFSVVLSIILMTGVAFLFESCGKGQPSAPANSEVGLVFDVGGRGDKSFNDAAYLGLQMAKDSL